jgi:O-succinylbenzoic acid--CoA ligase
MSRPAATRPLVRVPVPPGAEGPARVLPALAAALDGSGPAIAPIPTVSSAVSNDYVMTLLAAVRADDPALPLESADVALVVATSGSTGAPRGVLLTGAQLTALTDVVNGPGQPQWIAALPVTSMGGLNVLVRALASGREPVVVPSIGGAGPFTDLAFAAAVDAAAAESDDIRVALVPAQVSRLLSSDRGIGALQRCTSILVGGAATRPSLRAAATDLGITLTTTYGATETAGGCVFDGRPLPGVTVTADGTPGKLTIAGPTVALGYRGEPELTRARFGAGVFRTADLGEVGADGSVTVLGRDDDVVVIGGVNVSPLAVERVIADLPDIVAAAAVSALARSGDARLHAFIEVRDTASGAEDEARDEVVRRLGRAATPTVHRVARLPHLPNGKVDRRLLQQWAAEGTD